MTSACVAFLPLESDIVDGMQAAARCCAAALPTWGRPTSYIRC